MAHEMVALFKAQHKYSESNIPGPAPHQRHAQPSGPWPWTDVDSPDQEGDENTPVPSVNALSPWRGYPQCHFPNWTPAQVRRSKIMDAVDKKQDLPCKIHCSDIMNAGKFEPGKMTTIDGTKTSQELFWERIHEKRPDGIRVRFLCIENLSGTVLQMLGHRYKVEPFFWSSSFNWLPSRYQEIVPSIEGDHITITLTFIRSTSEPALVPRADGSCEPRRRPLTRDESQATLFLSSSGKVLRQDLLALHMIRSPQGSTIISYHPDSEWQTTSAKVLHSRIASAGRSVYWQNIFQTASDPTFILLTILWHALYSWDQALEQLYVQILDLEAKVIRTNDTSLSSELHIIRAHLLHYESLLTDFNKSVVFIRETPNPAMDAIQQDSAKKVNEKDLFRRECGNLMSEIERLERSRETQHKRLNNVMNLAFSIVNIGDSAAMKQIAYLTMIFLPANFAAAVFGMNIRILSDGTHGTLAHYFAVAIPLTALTIWLIVAFQSKKYFAEGKEATVFRNLLWPYKYAKRFWKARVLPPKNRKKNDDLSV
ncbi:hypothetical protein FIBSPDRAFT_469777 [Athelia psychrophila]|uniref:Cora-domain-containing protein n=1 Tax=Athelia psychrophila TaxID=1759441 RepID=A0A166LH13_9AGAM|nr:hypothetical protein FIBSPDRAFT_469777 [Fibularhizoctonia sp. CBS 109695]